ncbi:class I SAM-dependent RNA methyltransferase [Acidicapsa dinghuensis]|uniref:Class I SAM-dependent RNA methyltransferase n=1 Tax=Acidicapsa dinghuensis TaxID=2218256 RepID=A0ABW1EIC5_9BACT|nr:class I SAM-dependent RNA methyltransferase [Acidicapsa dinghuensis]
MKLHTEKSVYGGDCLARLDSQQTDGKSAGKKVFVPLTLPGETVEARILEDKRAFARAEIETILSASPNRIEPRCPHFGICGGCQYQHANYSTQLAIKRSILRETLDRAKVPSPAEIHTLVGSEEQSWRYRNRIRLAFIRDSTHDAQGRTQVGYRSRRSHDLVPIDECPIAAPILVECALDLASVIDSNDPRNDLTENDLTEVELFINHDNSEMLVTFFRVQGEPILRSLRFVPVAGSSRPKLERTDAQSLTYAVAGHEYRVDGGAFFQINRHLLDRFTTLVTDGLTGSLAWDLYAGVGLFARRLTQTFNMVHAVESAPASTAALQHNLAGANSHASALTTLDYLRRNREQREPRPDVIVLDPPRAGLGDEVAHLLNAIGAPQLVYVSCDPATLARDLHALTRERYRIEAIHLADMFPQTFHLETVVRLRRI